MSISRQKVSAAMRKAGLPAAKWNASGMVRGWGSWASGVRVTQDSEGVYARWVYGTWGKQTAEGMASNNARIAAALESAGIPATFDAKRDQYSVGGVA